MGKFHPDNPYLLDLAYWYRDQTIVTKFKSGEELVVTGKKAITLAHLKTIAAELWEIRHTVEKKETYHAHE